MPSMEFLYEKEIVCKDTGEVCNGYNYATCPNSCHVRKVC